MAAIQYARLYPDALQLQAKNGTNLTAGWVMVFLAGTDDPAVTYADFNGTVNPQKIVIDDNGRFCAIVDKAKAYRVEVYDSEGMLQWTTEPVWCTGNAGSGMSVTRVISTDGSITVDENIAGTERTYDIGIAPSDNDEFLEWIKCSEEDCDSTWKPVYQAGTMETEAGQGIKVHGGHLYHFTNTFYVDPDGTGITYSTFQVNMYCNDQIVDSRNFDIDTSVNDSVQCEFSTDVIPEEDGHVYFTLNIPSGCEVTGEVQCHRIYSGINAVPDTCATKQWVQETFDYNLSSKVDYSAIEYNQTGAITGISGSAIATTDPTVVSSIASSYAESAISSISAWSGDFSSISSKIDWSSSGIFQPSGDYAYNSSLSSKVDQSAFDDCCSAVHSALDDKIDKSASGQFAPSGDYAYNSSLSDYIPTSASGMFQPSGDYQSAGDYAFNSAVSSKLDASASSSFVLNSSFSSYSSNVGDTINNLSSSITSIENNITSISSVVSGITEDWSSKADTSALDDKLDKTASGMFQPSGDYAYNSSLSGYVDTSTYSSFSSEVTNNISSISSTVSGLTGQYIEQSASGMFQPSGNYVSADDMSAYVPFSGLEGDGSKITGISGSAIKGHEYTGIAPVNVDNTNDQISVDHRTLCVDSTMTAYNSGSSAVIGVNVAGLDLSSKMDASASSLFYPSDNPSGFITGVDLTPYQTTAGMTAYQEVSGMTAYQPSGDYIYVSALGWAEV
jgi:hypothetical protein